MNELEQRSSNTCGSPGRNKEPVVVGSSQLRKGHWAEDGYADREGPGPPY
jgi:hypothetical protein